MSTRYPGGLISRSKPVIVGPVDGEGGSAPGVWTLEQASYYTKQGTWPQKTPQRNLFLVGAGTYGQLGTNSVTNRSSPVQVGSDKNWKSIAFGDYAVLAVQSTGALWSWGANGSGALGVSDTVNRSSPVQVGALTSWKNVDCAYAGFATKTDGTLWSWGANANGQLGQNNIVSRSSPVQIGSGTDWLSIAAGTASFDGVLALKTNGTLWSWGANPLGQLGQNDKVYRSSPVQVGALTTWLIISCGVYVSGAIQSNGTMWTWGYNSDGELGQGDRNISRSSPTQVGALTSWSNICYGGSFALATKTDGTLWGWGVGSSGQLGNSSVANRSSPVQIGALTTWTSLGATWLSSYGVLSNGTLWSWGSNSSDGRLGVNSVINYSSPVQIGSSQSWSAISGGVTAVAFVEKIS